MLFRTHMVFSLMIYFLLSYIIEMPFFVLGFILLATAFVDIDIGSSKIGKVWIFRPLQWLTKHRGVIHSLPAALLISLVIAGFNNWAGFGFFVGYVSHLLMDCLTKSGVRLFWPLKFKIKGFINSGKTFEDVIFVLLLLGNIFIVGKILFDIFF